MLGLLAFVLALTLSYSTARFSERRQATLNEANAIGTAFLRASAIGSPQAVEVALSAISSACGAGRSACSSFS